MAPAAGKVRILFMTGGGYHDFVENPKILLHVLDQIGGFDVTVTQDREALTNLKAYDVAMFYTQGGDLTPLQEKGLTDFVASGKGYIGMHCASDSFKTSDKYWQLVGGRFKSHGHEVFGVKVMPEGPAAPIAKEIDGFLINDETYVNDIFPKAKLDVLARRKTDNEPAAWTQGFGKGRVFYTNLGHDKWAWGNEGFQKLVLHGLYWVAKQKPPKTLTKVEWGFRPLFNGTDLTGWVPPSDGWKVVDGVIDCTGGKGGWLRSEDQFEDFEMRYEYRIAKDGNSGTFIRAKLENDPAFTGHEIQILDDFGKKPDLHSSGSLYDAVAPAINPSKPAWEWNQVTIRCIGRQLAVTQNGHQLMDVNLDDPKINENQSEERKMWNRAKSGYVGFQDHGDRVEFRNIRIRSYEKLPAP